VMGHRFARLVLVLPTGSCACKSSIDDFPIQTNSLQIGNCCRIKELVLRFTMKERECKPKATTGREIENDRKFNIMTRSCSIT
jgi:hypothetical protein